jgi:hypothetical protein
MISYCHLSSIAELSDVAMMEPWHPNVVELWHEAAVESMDHLADIKFVKIFIFGTQWLGINFLY